MEPLDKLEIIIKGMIIQKKREREKSKDKHSNLYILGLDHEIDMLNLLLGEIDAIRRNASRVSDEIIFKMYGAKE